MPKAFKFRLEPLLELRRLREGIARRELAEAKRAVMEQNDRLLAILGEEDEGKTALRSMKQRELDVVQLRLHEGYLASLGRKLRREFEELQHRVKRELEKRRAVLEAAKGVKVLERLRERRRRAYLYEIDREEQKFLDEVAQNRPR